MLGPMRYWKGGRCLEVLGLRTNTRACVSLCMDDCVLTLTYKGKKIESDGEKATVIQIG